MKKPSTGGRKSWCYWMEFLQEERRKISDPIPYPYGSLWYLSGEKRDALLVQYDALAEVACECLVLDDVWPEMEPEVRHAVACRLDAVCELASNLYFAQGIRTRVVLRPPDLSVTPMSEVWKFFSSTGGSALVRNRFPITTTACFKKNARRVLLWLR